MLLLLLRHTLYVPAVSFVLCENFVKLLWSFWYCYYFNSRRLLLWLHTKYFIFIFSFVQLIHIVRFTRSCECTSVNFVWFYIYMNLYLSYEFHWNPIVLHLMTTACRYRKKENGSEERKGERGSSLSHSNKLYVLPRESGDENIVSWATSKRDTQKLTHIQINTRICLASLT